MHRISWRIGDTTPRVSGISTRIREKEGENYPRDSHSVRQTNRCSKGSVRRSQRKHDNWDQRSSHTGIWSTSIGHKLRHWWGRRTIPEGVFQRQSNHLKFWYKRWNSGKNCKGGRWGKKRKTGDNPVEKDIYHKYMNQHYKANSINMGPCYLTLKIIWDTRWLNLMILKNNRCHHDSEV